MSTADFDGAIERHEDTQILKRPPDGMDRVRPEDRELLTDLVFDVAELYTAEGMDIDDMLIVEYDTLYNLTTRLKKGNVTLEHMQKLQRRSPTLVKRVYFDIAEELLVVQVEKDSSRVARLPDESSTSAPTSTTNGGSATSKALAIVRNGNGNGVARARRRGTNRSLLGRMLFGSGD